MPRWLRPLLAGAALLVAGAAAPPPGKAELDVSVSGLRNHRGTVMLCLTRRGDGLFLACGKDPARVSRVAPAAGAAVFHIGPLAPGDYSLLVIHDENRNGRLDKSMGMPREGFGFSRNPGIRLGPPRYADVRFTLGAGRAQQDVKLRYLL